MPLLSISTSASISNKGNFLRDASMLMSNLTNKPEKYVMVKISDSLDMYFDKSSSDSCFVEIKSIGSLNPSLMAEKITDFISNEIDIPGDRIYINFEDVPSSLWAHNRRTFG